MSTRRRAGLTGQPHDAIIKFTFSQKEHAIGLIKAALAEEISSHIDFSTLEVEKIHFVDRSLRARYADLLFSARMNGERVYVYVLVEHQSEVQPLMIFRIGSYMWRHWEGLVRDEPTRQTLPPILPILIHHSPTGWTAATAFEDIVAWPSPTPEVRAAMAPYIPRFRMRLVDVSHDPSGGLVRQALTDLGRVVLWCLSVAGDRGRLEGEIDTWVRELNELYATRRHVDALIALLRYLVATQPKLSVKTIVKLLETTAEKGEREVDVDVLDELKREGREEGLREGEREGGRKAIARTLLMQLAARFGAVPDDAKEQVLAAPEATLSRWLMRVLTAESLDEVLGKSRTAKKAAKKVAASPRRRVAKSARGR